MNENDLNDIRPLSEYSPITSLNAGDQYFLYVKKEDVNAARKIIDPAIREFEAKNVSLHAGEKAREEVSETPTTEKATVAKKPASNIASEDSQQTLGLIEKDGPNA